MTQFSISKLLCHCPVMDFLTSMQNFLENQFISMSLEFQSVQRQLLPLVFINFFVLSPGRRVSTWMASKFVARSEKRPMNRPSFD